MKVPVLKFTFLLLAIIGLSIGGPIAGEADPLTLLKKKDAELQKLLRNKDSGKKADRIKFLINDMFDFKELGKRALGTKKWNSITPKQQVRFVNAFKEMVENSSVKKLEVYRADSTVYETPKIQDGKATVTVHAFSKGQESILVYKMIKQDTTWKAWDLVIDDLSTARNYGEQFKKILESTDMDGLIAKIEKSAKSSDSGRTTDSVKSKSEKQNKASAAALSSSSATVATPAKNKKALIKVQSDTNSMGSDSASHVEK